MDSEYLIYAFVQHDCNMAQKSSWKPKFTINWCGWFTFDMKLLRQKRMFNCERHIEKADFIA